MHVRSTSDSLEGKRKSASVSLKLLAFPRKLVPLRKLESQRRIALLRRLA